MHSLAIKGEGGLEREGGVFFWGGGGGVDTPMHTLSRFLL